MATRGPPESESPEPNDPSVEAAFEAAPEGMVAEILDGELHLRPRLHAPGASRLGRLLGGEPGDWLLLDAPELHLGARPDRVVPDVAGWRRERVPADSGGDAVPPGLVPHWVCEVLAEPTRDQQRGVKMRIYAREGVRHVWHVDPLARTLDVFRLLADQWFHLQSFSGEGRVRAEPFAALELELSRLWE